MSNITITKEQFTFAFQSALTKNTGVLLPQIYLLLFSSYNKTINSIGNALIASERLEMLTMICLMFSSDLNKIDLTCDADLNYVAKNWILETPRNLYLKIMNSTTINCKVKEHLAFFVFNLRNNSIENPQIPEN